MPIYFDTESTKITTKEATECSSKQDRLQNVLTFASSCSMSMPKASRQVGGKIFGGSPSLANKERNALTFFEQGRILEAELLSLRLIDLGTSNKNIFKTLLAIYKAKGKMANVAKLEKKIDEHFPSDSDLHYKLGECMHACNMLENAVIHLHKAVNNPLANHSIAKRAAIAIHEIGDVDKAIDSYKLLLGKDSQDDHLWYNLGAAQYQQGNTLEAITSYKCALQINPGHTKSLCNLGIAYSEDSKPEKAISCLTKAITINPRNWEATQILANIYLENNYIDSAISCLYDCLELDPSNIHIKWSLSQALLAKGDFANGWHDFELRKHFGDVDGLIYLPSLKRYNGSNLCLNERLLVISEQGLGDIIHFARYIRDIAAKQIDVVFCVPDKLFTLFEESALPCQICLVEQAKEIKDAKWIPLLDLPKLLQISHSNPGLPSNYLRTKEAHSLKWSKKLSSLSNPVIGINWQGNPEHELTGLKGRSLPLHSFSRVAHNSNGSILSLQKGYGSEQLLDCGFSDYFCSHQEEINQTWDFLETAAIIENCDLVITSDTAVAHLSGSLGQTTWLLLTRTSEWRWGLEGDKTFWYPSMRLFRQTEKGNWSEVIKRVEAELQNFS